MDNHPIPQDITGYQFKLIGDMTIKQFIYLAIGAVFAFFFFFILDIPTLVQWPLSLFCLGSGIIIAFVPVDGRPMDQMVRNFFRAIVSPTQFVYQKGSVPETNNTSPSPKIHSIARPMPISPSQEVAAQKQSTPTPVAAPEEKKSEGPDHKKENQELKKQLEELQKKLSEKDTKEMVSPQPAAQAPQQDNQDLEKMLSESQRQKEALEKQILEMQAKQDASKKQKFTPITAEPIQQTQNVRKIQADTTNSAGLPEEPNLISGIIKDSRGNPLQNILIEVLDQDANPVRAFKTNSLGKFASATSLSNGKYTISFEDPGEKHKFDAVEMELTGSPVMPIEVISIDSREELRRELFN